MAAHQIENYLEQAEEAAELLHRQVKGRHKAYDERSVILALAAIGLRERSGASILASDQEMYKALSEISIQAEQALMKLKACGMDPGKVQCLLEDGALHLHYMCRDLKGNEPDAVLCQHAESIDRLGLAVVGAVSLGMMDESRLAKVAVAESMPGLVKVNPLLISGWSEGLLSTLDRLNGRPDLGKDLAKALEMSSRVVWVAYKASKE